MQDLGDSARSPLIGPLAGRFAEHQRMISCAPLKYLYTIIHGQLALNAMNGRDVVQKVTG